MVLGRAAQASKEGEQMAVLPVLPLSVPLNDLPYKM